MFNYLFMALSIILGFIFGYICVLCFQKFPEAWLQDYDYDVNSPNFRLAKRMSYKPHGLIASVVLSALYLFMTFNVIHFDSYKLFYILSTVLILPVCIMTIFADKLNRIIPDEFSIFIFCMGFIRILSDLVDKNLFFKNQNWLFLVLNHVIACIAGVLILFLLNFICETFIGKAGIGMGDVKLLGAIGFTTGILGFIFTIYFSVLTALLFAIPLYIKKIQRKNAEKELIKNSDDPDKTRQEIAIKKGQIHYADNPDYMAFGPFLALGVAIFCVSEPLLAHFLTNANFFIQLMEKFN